MSAFKDIPQEYFDELEAATPEHLKKLVREVVAAFLLKLDIPEEDRDEVIDKIKTRGFSEMFELVDGYSVKETRKVAKEEEKERLTTEFVKKLLRRNRPIEEIIEDTGLAREEIQGDSCEKQV